MQHQGKVKLTQPEQVLQVTALDDSPASQGVDSV